METGEMLEALDLDAHDGAAAALYRRAGALDGFRRAPEDWQRLATAIVRRMTGHPGDPPGPLPLWSTGGIARVLGLAGGQGAGKSTLARALAAAFEAAGARALAVSLDDFYLTRRARESLGAAMHPLLRTRGVPGTHDVELLVSVLAALRAGDPVAVPVFDKGLDDRLPEAGWRRVAGRHDVVILEGWCLGARPQRDVALDAPCNALEAQEDPRGVWRHYVNMALAGPYRELWNALDALIFLRVPGMDAVLRWRALQEQALPAERRMSEPALARFVAHYERITLEALREDPPTASVIVELDHEHRVAAIRVPQSR